MTATFLPVGSAFTGTKGLAEAGVKKILVEKPGATAFKEIEDLLRIEAQMKAEISKN